MGVESVDDKGTWSRTVAFLSHPVAVIALSAVVRLVTAVAGWERLNADPDSYRQLAETLAQTGSYSRPDPVDGVLYPTAYRPPLYPLLLACLATQEGVPRLLIAGLHGLLGVGTVALVLHAGRRLGLGRRSAIAGVLTACDPILLHQSTRRWRRSWPRAGWRAHSRRCFHASVPIGLPIAMRAALRADSRADSRGRLRVGKTWIG
jgi:hypothetical protein